MRSSSGRCGSDEHRPVRRSRPTRTSAAPHHRGRLRRRRASQLCTGRSGSFTTKACSPPRSPTTSLQNRNVKFLWEGFLKNLQAAALAHRGLDPVRPGVRGRPTQRPPAGATARRRRRSSSSGPCRWSCSSSSSSTSTSDIGILGCLVLGLMLYNGSVLAEVFRAGVLAVDKGPVRGGLRDRYAQEPGDDADPAAAGSEVHAAGDHQPVRDHPEGHVTRIHHLV